MKISKCDICGRISNYPTVEDGDKIILYKKQYEDVCNYCKAQLEKLILSMKEAK